MTTAADDAAVEEAFEALLAGRPVPEQGASLAAFAEAVRSSASAPGRPNAALADLLANGLLTDQPSPSLRTAPRRRRRAALLVPAVLAKIVSAGAIAQAATGAVIVLVAFAGAGVAGALPDSLQHGFATVASTVGIQVEDPQQTDPATPATPAAPATPDGTEGDGSGTAPDPGDDTAAPATGDGYTFEDWEKGPAEGQSFGDWVSEGAKHGYADGAVISREARERGVVLPGETAAPTEDPAGETEHGATPAPTGPGGGSGHGNGDRNGDRSGDRVGAGSGDGNRGPDGPGNGHGNGSSGGSVGHGHGDD